MSYKADTSMTLRQQRLARRGAIELGPQISSNDPILDHGELEEDALEKAEALLAMKQKHAGSPKKSQGKVKSGRKRDNSLHESDIQHRRRRSSAIEEDLVTDKHRIPAEDVNDENQDELDSSDEGEEGEEEYDPEEMVDFIAPDHEVAEEILQERQAQIERRKNKRERSGARQRPGTIKQLDQEDLEILAENLGTIVKQKKIRLKRNAEIEAEQQAAATGINIEKTEVSERNSADQLYSTKTIVRNDPKASQQRSNEMQIDTAIQPTDKSGSPVRGEYLRYHDERPVIQGNIIDLERLKKAQAIFGDDYDEETPAVGSLPAYNMLKDERKRNAAGAGNQNDQLTTAKTFFPANEVDDPFSTERDNRIAEADVPERINVRIDPQTKAPTDGDLRLEAEWMLERLTSLPGSRYSNLLSSKEASEKIFQVLQMIHQKYLDIPMIAKYRKYQYEDDLDEQAVWHLWNLDIEYVKFRRQKQQIEEFLRRVEQIEMMPDGNAAGAALVQTYLNELLYARTMSELTNFQALIRFLRSQYEEQLKAAEQDTRPRRKQPQRRDELQTARQSDLHKFSTFCFLSQAQYTENLQLRKLATEPPEPTSPPNAFAQQFQCDQYPNELDVFKGVCNYAAQELAAQPFIRNLMKKAFREFGMLSTYPTEQGLQDLDLFHPNYRVKNVNEYALSDLSNQSDLYLDIYQCEKSGLVTVQIDLEPHKAENLRIFLEEQYMCQSTVKENWNILRSEVIRLLTKQILEPEIKKEVREELREAAELFVISKCKETYRRLLMTGPFQTTNEIQPARIASINAPDEANIIKRHTNLQKDTEIIKDRERLCVMGALMHQISANNYIVTISVVDKFGDVVAYKDFMRLLPPRQRKQPAGVPAATALAAGVQNPASVDFLSNTTPRLPSGVESGLQVAGTNAAGLPQVGIIPLTEEQREHEQDKAGLIGILEQNSVDLIVVAANSLEARTLKRVLEEIAIELKNKQTNQKVKVGTHTDSSVTTQRPKSGGLAAGSVDKTQTSEASGKEAFVIWGSTEVGKLFAVSHNSQRLHKGVPQILKQSISMARFQQDPLAEVLNLWSSIPAENQALALLLDPMQKLVSQVRLAEALEEVNIECVNEVGIDLNLVVDHEHLHGQVQFISGLGPRKARVLIKRIKQLDKKLFTRGEILKTGLLKYQVYISAVPFLKIRVPVEDFYGVVAAHKCDILDQTRIHHESYKLAMKLAMDACADGESKELEKVDQNRFCREVIAAPDRLRSLDLKQYFAKLETTNMGNMNTIIKLIIAEFRHPFADPREPRMPTKQAIGNEQLFYLLIDETPRTFHRGLLVTASVSRVLESKALCRLENGLSAIIPATAFSEEPLAFGHIVTGRIEKISTEDEKRFEVTLHCNQKDLASHKRYLEDLCAVAGVNMNSVPSSDCVNQSFAVDTKPKQLGRFVPRRIAHEKFKNISSRRALTDLENSEVGDFVFRPNTRSEDHITLTWKFWKRHFVHIEIAEQQKAAGAAIGAELYINQEKFQTLKEIVERYIIPCNRLVRDVIQFDKFFDIEKWEELEEALKEEKIADKARIPYRLAILPQYPQHVVLAYVPRERVIREFIKVRPRGYYFHDETKPNFVSLINWFKEHYASKEYQRFLKRQRSPRTQARQSQVLPDQMSKESRRDEYSQGPSNKQESVGRSHQFNQGHTPQGGSSARDEQGRAPRRQSRGQGSYRSGQRPDSPNAWGNSGGNFKSEGPAGGGDWGTQASGWGNKRQEDVQMAEQSSGANFGGHDRSRNFQSSGDRQRSSACFKCQQEGHQARDCPNADTRESRPRSSVCHKCGEEGHFIRECPNNVGGGSRREGGPSSSECYRCHQIGHIARDCPNDENPERGSGYKRQRRDEGSSRRRESDGERRRGGWTAEKTGGASGWGDQQQTQDKGGWQAQGAQATGWSKPAVPDPKKSNESQGTGGGGWGANASNSQGASGW